MATDLVYSVKDISRPKDKVDPPPQAGLRQDQEKRDKTENRVNLATNKQKNLFEVIELKTA